MKLEMKIVPIRLIWCLVVETRIVSRPANYSKILPAGDNGLQEPTLRIGSFIVKNGFLRSIGRISMPDLRIRQVDFNTCAVFIEGKSQPPYHHPFQTDVEKYLAIVR